MNLQPDFNSFEIVALFSVVYSNRFGAATDKRRLFDDCLVRPAWRYEEQLVILLLSACTLWPVDILVQQRMSVMVGGI